MRSPCAMQQIIGISLLILMSAVPVNAIDCTSPEVTNAGAATAALNDLRTDGCLGGNACTTRLCAKIGAFVNKWCFKNTGEFCKPAKFSAELFSEAKDLVGQVKEKAELLSAEGIVVPKLKGMMERWDSTFGAIGTTPVSGARITEWDTGGMRLFPETVYMVDVEKEVFAIECTTQDRCQKCFDSVLDVYTEATLIHRVLAVLAGAEVQDSFKHLKQIDARWHAYHNETRAIYPWEIWVNGRLVQDSKYRGFAEPPDRQILFLHPSAGLEYRFSGNDRMQAAVLLDVIGFYWWKWGGEQEAEVKRSMGVSIAAWYDGIEPSYGATAHFLKNLSLGVGADRHGKLSLTLSADLGNFLIDKKNSIEELKTKLQ